MSRWLVSGALIVGALAGESVVAETLPGSQAARAWEGEWKAGVVEEPVRDSVSGEGVVVAAYLALWIILFLYVVRLSMNLNALRRDIEELRRRLEAQGRS